MTGKLLTIEDCDLVLSEIESINDSDRLFAKSAARAREILSGVRRIPEHIYPVMTGGVLMVYVDNKGNYREFTIIGNDIHTFYCGYNDDITDIDFDSDIDIKLMDELINNMEWDD